MRKLKRSRAEEILAECQDHARAALDGVRQRVDEWAENIAFYRGVHHYVRNGSFIADTDEATGERQEVHNYIPAFVQAAVAVRMRNFPNPQVPAADGNQVSMARAAATERLVKSFVDDNVINKEELHRCLKFAACVGGGWIKEYWDPDGGKPVLERPAMKQVTKKDPETGEEYIEEIPETDEFGEPILSTDYEGRIEVEFVDTFDGWPDPLARKASDMRFWIHRKVEATDSLRDRFKKDIFGEELEFADMLPDDIWSNKVEVDGNDNENIGFFSSGKSNESTKTATLYECWMGRSDKFPNGLLCVWTGNQIIHIGPNPYKPCRIPVTLFLGDNLIPGGIYADGMVKHLKPLQRNLNVMESKKAEILANVSNPHWLVPQGGVTNPGNIGNIPGQIIEYTPGLKPEISMTPGVPPGFFEQARELPSRMKEISTYSDISRGDIPTGVESGRAIAFLTENEQNIREPDLAIYKQAMLDVMQQCMYLAKQFYEDGRMIRSLGEEGWTVTEFKDEDYDWFIDLSPEPFSGAPNSRALRFAEGLELYQQGVFDSDSPGAKALLRMLSMDHGGRNMFDPLMQDRNLARAENMQLIQVAKGKVEAVDQVEIYHEHAAHLDEHNKFRNSMEFKNLPPQIREMFNEHCDLHEQYIGAQTQEYAQMQGMIGQGGSMGTPPAQPGIESPLDGGAPAGEPQPQSIGGFAQEQAASSVGPQILQ